MMNDPKVFICIPTYNEKGNIEKLIRAIFDLKLPRLNIVVIDDNSPDGTAEIVEKLSGELYVHLIKRPGKMGIGSAYIDGFKYAISRGADLIFEMDADFSHNPTKIPEMIAESQKGFDLVLGSRRVKNGRINGWDFWRHFSSSGAMWFSRLILGLKTKDVTTGFRCYQRGALEKLNLDIIKSNGYAFQEEMIYRTEKKGFKIKEIPIVFEDRLHGKSKLTYREIIEFFVRMVQLRFSRIK